ncbi:unnamed protein product [Rhizophagus irregularis]|nr:unnamed protein product [Rhizophagus irregularis]
MGITISREDFVALEGYAQKSDEERREILQNAGMELTEEDTQIAKFLGTNDTVLGCFIRGIIKTCLHLFNAQRTKEFNTYIEEYKTATNEMLQQKSLEINEWTRLKEEEWNRKEEYYFWHTNIKKHQIQIEVGTVDTEDKEKMEEQQRLLRREQCRKQLELSPASLDTSEVISLNAEWKNASATSGDESENETKMSREYYKINKTLHPQGNITPINTNEKSQMQEENENRNFQNSRDQSITMAYTTDHDMGENSKRSKDSMHKPKSANDLKYFAGLFTYQIKNGQTDQSVIEYLNNNKILEYHMNTIGRMTNHGNEYTYIGFFTETAKNNFIKDERVTETIGKFRDLEWLNKMNKKLTLSITEIDKKYMDLDDVIKAIENKFGKMLDIQQREKNGRMISLKLAMEIKCTEDELLNTWGILIKNKMIKVELINYKYHVIRQRGRTTANIMDIPNEIDEQAFTKILKETEARYWFKTKTGSPNTYNIMETKHLRGFFRPAQGRMIGFGMEKDKMDTMEITKGKDTTEDKADGSDAIYAKRIITRQTNVTSTNQRKTTTKEEEKQENTTKKKESLVKKDTTMKEISQLKDNMEATTTTADTTARQETIQITTDTTIETEATEVTTTTEDNNLEDLIIGIKNMKMEDTEIGTTTIDNITTNHNNNPTTDDTLTRTDTILEKEKKMEATTTTDTGTNTEEREEEDTIMADAIEIFKNLEITKAQEEQEEERKGKEKEKIRKNRKNNKKSTEKIDKEKNIIINKSEKKQKNNENIKIGCINVRGMNDIKKQGDIRKFIGKENWNIAILTETKLKETKGKFVFKGWETYESINSSFNNDNTKNGIIILLKKNINDRRYKIEQIDGHVIKLDILFKGKQKNIRIIGIYNPVEEKTTTERICTQVNKWIEEAKQWDHELIILGDFNESTKNKKKKKPLTNTLKNHGLQDVYECMTTGKIC